MQEMAAGVCHSAQYETEGRLQDTRDNKVYWVAKLRDGNCWMTQNLDLDLYVNNAGRTLTPNDSDVISNWTSNTGVSALWTSSDGNVAKYYDPGEKYCNTSNCNLTTSANNGHDAQGNYYSWVAATAGDTRASGDANESICPKGWQLPTSNNTDAIQKSFGGLTTVYNINNDAAGSATLRAAPFYFVYGGFVNISSLGNAGSRGYYWSSTANSATSACSLGFNSSSVNPSDGYNRYVGNSVRCVAR